MPHVVLLGDSIFDNANYVPDRPAVEEQVRRALPEEWKVTLLAIDGHTTEDVAGQLTRLPEDATHLFVSAGGNDALQAGWILGQRVYSVDEALKLLEEVRAGFTEKYREMLRTIIATERRVVVCTVYDQVPGLGAAERAALAGFNEVIFREAVAARIPVIDLRLICDRASDYSRVSPIEPSDLGGFKIARVIAKVAVSERLDEGICAIFV
jgi:GDSL-like Lipase/Acylhydrolase family